MRAAILAAGVVAACGAAALCVTYQEYASAYYETALREARISESVLLDDTPIRVEHGDIHLTGRKRYEALRLAYAKASARRAPLFALVGTAPDALKNTLEELEDLEAQLVDFQKEERWKESVKDNLYPIDLLAHLAEVEKRRLTFLETGTSAAEAAYTQALSNTPSIYERTLYRFTEAFKKATKPDATTYAAGTKIVNRTGILAGIEAARAGMRGVNAQMRERLACTSGAVHKCHTTDITPPSPTGGEVKDVPSFLGEILALQADTGAPMQPPYIALSSSKCMREHVSPIVGRYLPTATSAPRLILVGDIRFIPNKNHLKIAFIDYFYDKGLSYIPSSPANYYECLEFAHDLGRLFAVEGVRTFAAQTPISTFAQENKNELATLERRLSADVVQEADAAAYLALALSMPEHAKLPEAIQNELYSLSVQFVNRSTRIDVLIASIVRLETANLKLEPSIITAGLSAPYLFFIRNAFPSLFATDNLSITGSHEPLFQKNTRPAVEEPYVYYSSLRNIPDIQNILRHDISNFRQVHQQWM